MSRSLFLLAISVVAAGCSDDSSTTCGPGGAATDGLTAGNGSDVSLTFENLSASANNDCPDPAAPSGVISLTITGSQKNGTGLVTFCVPRPDKLTTGNVQLGSDVKIVDLNGTSNSCMLTTNATTVPLGSVGSIGVCDNGTNHAGFALVFAGNVVLSRDCAGTVDNVPVQLVGTVAVSVP
jgi:hypothetical protein